MIRLYIHFIHLKNEVYILSYIKFSKNLAETTNQSEYYCFWKSPKYLIRNLILKVKKFTEKAMHFKRFEEAWKIKYFAESEELKIECLL